MSTRNPKGTAEQFLRSIILPFDSDECLPWPFSSNKDGHGTMKADGRTQLVSRVVCLRSYGLPPTPKHEAAHSCGKGHLGCVNPRHLRWATHAENESDKINHGTSNRGERHGMSKLSTAQVLAIREMVGSTRKVAKIFGVSQRTVSNIKSGAGWAHV